MRSILMYIGSKLIVVKISSKHSFPPQLLFFSQVISYVELRNLLFLVGLSSGGTKNSFLGNSFYFVFCHRDLLVLFALSGKRVWKTPTSLLLTVRGKAGNTLKQ